MKNIGSFLTGAFIGLSAVIYFILYPETWSVRSVLIIAASIIVSLPLSILLHEAGHFLAGRLQGMRLLNLSVGPFVIERHEGKLHFHMTPSVLGYLGRAMMGFPEQVKKEVMRNQLVRYVYGGPLTNIIIGFLLMGIAFGLWHHPFYLIFGLVNVFLGFMNLKPVMAKSVMTDGLVIQRLRMIPVEDSVIIAAYSVLAEGMRTADVKKWDADLIEQLERLIKSEDATAKSLLPTLGYYYLPANPEILLTIGQTLAFTREDASYDYYADCADITFATSLFFNEELKDYPGILEGLRKIGKSDAVIDSKRNALLSYIEGDFTGAIVHLESAKDSLGKWHPLYLRGEMERKLLTSMIDRI
ncbi:site-2 protease family protein [Lederbergia citrisecunda]|uniref:site-2 protease family protein n=1 Tax=Lederbergia citrisecunda TaxID=2833583 RepID=UPI003D298E8D